MGNPEKFENHREELQKKCPNCGNILPESANFCPYCGGSQKIKEEPGEGKKEDRDVIEKKELTIEGAANFDELYKAIEAKGTVKGSQREFTAEKLKGIIKEVRYVLLNEQQRYEAKGISDGEIKIQGWERAKNWQLHLVTRSEGLRDKVTELIGKETEWIEKEWARRKKEVEDVKIQKEKEN